MLHVSDDSVESGDGMPWVTAKDCVPSNHWQGLSSSHPVRGTPQPDDSLLFFTC